MSTAPTHAWARLVCPDTGSTVDVPESTLQAAPRAAAELRRRVRALDVQSAWAADEAEGAVSAAGFTVDVKARTYRLTQYPPLGFFLQELLGLRWRVFAVGLIICGSLFIAACAQIQFSFPCLMGYTLVAPPGASKSYCVANSDVGAASGCTSTPISPLCSARIPVTMQTYSVMLMGAIGGQSGALATVLYVLLVCVGAPFGAGQGALGRGTPVWANGGIVGSTGGYLVGFVFMTLIMGKGAERGAGRPSWRSSALLIGWMLAAELALYAVGLFWLPFGVHFQFGTPLATYCPDAGTCLSKVFTTGLVPFIPGEVFKMALLLVTVPAAWAALLRLHAWRKGRAEGGALGALWEDDEGGLCAEGGAQREGSAGASDPAVVHLRSTSAAAASPSAPTAAESWLVGTPDPKESANNSTHVSPRVLID